MATRKTPSLDPDFRDFIDALNCERVRYLLVGGYAVNYYGHHRYTGDIDFWIAIDPENAARVAAAMERFGFGGPNADPSRFLEPNCHHMFGVPPTRIDLLSNPSGVEFEECFRRRRLVELDGLTVSLIDLGDLRANKLASARDKDILDLKHLPEPPA